MRGGKSLEGALENLLRKKKLPKDLILALSTLSTQAQVQRLEPT
jgi:hypothetical protein